MTRRRFNVRERLSLFVSADGRCASCGVTLSGSWHADHVVPYARGGDTNVSNGQALCQSCNLRKGATMTTVDLRAWQQNARSLIRIAYREGRRDFLCVASPGAGKTRWSLSVLSDWLREIPSARVVVVVPTDHLRKQWAESAAEFGINLDPQFKNAHGREASDFHGCVVTYAGVASAADAFAVVTRNTPTIVVLDEVHHAGDSRSWGRGIQQAFDDATFRIELSGTPFRNSGGMIPFVTYTTDDDGRSRCNADYEYGYKDAHADGVCRSVMFPTYEGQFHWLQTSGEVVASFDDELTTEESARRLRTALDPRGSWLREIIGEADKQLGECRRNGHPVAGGLIVAFEQDDAKQIAKVVAAVTGETPVLVISEDSDASAKIEAFKHGSHRWMVAVKMVSEGVDIPRLRVGVYATRVISWLYFQQFIGRFVRTIDELEEQLAYVYLPADDELIAYARAIHADRQAHEPAIRYDVADDEDRELLDRAESGLRRDMFQPIRAGDARPDITLFGTDTYSVDEMLHADRVRMESGITIPTALIAQILRVDRQVRPVITHAESEPALVFAGVVSAGPTLRERKNELKRVISRYVGQIAAITNIEHREVNRQLYIETGAWINDSTLEQLEQRVTVLRGWLNEVSNG